MAENAAPGSLEQFRRDWARHRAEKRRTTAIAAAVFGVCLVASVVIGEFDPRRLIAGWPQFGEFFSRLVPPIGISTLGRDVADWYWGIGEWLALLGETLLMAFLATTVGAVSGAAIGFLGSRNLVSNGLVHFLARRVLEVARTVPDLVWALIFVFAFGLGPMAGVLAIGLHTLGAQGKLFAEVNENADMSPLEGVRAAGGGWIDEIRFGLLPQVLPNYVSYAFWRFEINVRLSTVVGFVGAGGIGVELYESLRLSYFDDVGAIILIVFVAVALIDMASEWLRLKLAHGEFASRRPVPQPAGAQ